MEIPCARYPNMTEVVALCWLKFRAAMVNRDALSTVFCVTWLILLPPRVTWRISGDFGFQVRHIFSPAERRLQRRVDGKPERMCHTTQIHFIWISFRASDVSPKKRQNSRVKKFSIINLDTNLQMNRLKWNFVWILLKSAVTNGCRRLQVLFSRICNRLAEDPIKVLLCAQWIRRWLRFIAALNFCYEEKA